MVVPPAYLRDIPPPPRGYDGCDEFRARERQRCWTVTTAAARALEPVGLVRGRLRRWRDRRTVKAPDAGRYLAAQRRASQWSHWKHVAYSDPGDMKSAARYHPNADASRLRCGKFPTPRGAPPPSGLVQLPPRPRAEVEGCKNIRDHRAEATVAFFRRYAERFAAARRRPVT